ncbi:MAG: hypothetical protein JST00_27665 [Deltaproteobacteria bacterium]|nr:hypothetical protein [Deltaproteobacteria bacterium]
MRSFVTAIVLTLASLVAVPALAAPSDDSTPAKTQRADGDKAKHAFPMPAAEFKAKVDQRQAKARARMEERAKSLDAAQAKELRDRFNANVAKVNAEVQKAIADGTVTKEEAKAVRQASGHHGKHAHKGKGKRGPKQ